MKIKPFKSPNSKEWIGSLLSFFMNIKSIDDNIETIRVALCSQMDFNPTQLFKYLDLKNKNFLLLNDFVKILNEMQIPFDEKNLRSFIHNFDKDNDFSLNFQEFLGLILPKKNLELKNRVLSLVNNSFISCTISINTKNIFGKLLCEELELVKNCLKTAKICRNSFGFTSYEAFIEISGNDKYITEKHLYNFLIRNNIAISSNDIHQLMFRIDADNDGNISFNEFEVIFFPMKEGDIMCTKKNFKEDNNEFYTISAISTQKPKIEITNKPLQKSNLGDFTFNQNPKINIENNNPNINKKDNSNQVNLPKNFNTIKNNLNLNKSPNINDMKMQNKFNYNLPNSQSGKKYSIYSKTERIIRSNNTSPQQIKETKPSQQSLKNLNNINNFNNINNNKINNLNNINNINNVNNINNINNINKNNNNINDISSSSFVKKPVKNYTYSSPGHNDNTLRHNSPFYKSPRLKHTQSPLHYDYSTYSDEDRDEFYKQKNLKQSAKTEYNRNFRIYPNSNTNTINNNIKNIPNNNNFINLDNKKNMMKNTRNNNLSNLDNRSHINKNVKFNNFNNLDNKNNMIKNIKFNNINNINSYNLNKNINFRNNTMTKPCCGCSILDTLCPCLINTKFVGNCICPKKVKTNFNFNTGYPKKLMEEAKNNNNINIINNKMNSQLLKSKSQLNFFYESANKNENDINLRKLEEAKLFGINKNNIN